MTCRHRQGVQAGGRDRLLHNITSLHILLFPLGVGKFRFFLPASLLHLQHFHKFISRISAQLGPRAEEFPIMQAADVHGDSQTRMCAGNNPPASVLLLRGLGTGTRQFSLLLTMKSKQIPSQITILALGRYQFLQNNAVSCWIVEINLVRQNVPPSSTPLWAVVILFLLSQGGQGRLQSRKLEKPTWQGGNCGMAICLHSSTDTPAMS